VAALAICHGDSEVRGVDPGRGPLQIFGHLGWFCWRGCEVVVQTSEVRRLPRCPGRISEDKSGDGEDGGDGDWGDEDEGTTIADPGYCCIRWEGWPGHWPKSMEARVQQTESI